MTYKNLCFVLKGVLEFYGNDFTGVMPSEVCSLRIPNGLVVALTADCFGNPPQLSCTCCTACASS